MRVERLWAMARKEAIQLRRDPRSLILAFALPLFFIVFFSYAITFDVKDIRMGVLDQDATQRSRSLVEAFTSSGYFTISHRLTRPAEAERFLAEGAVRLVLVIPMGFARDLGRPDGTALQLLVDGADANTATIAVNYAEAIVAGWVVGSDRGQTRAAGDGRGWPGAVEVRSRVWYNETLESKNMIVPGLVAVLMMMLSAMLTALTIAREWERGTMEQLAATPVGRVEVVLGKLLPYLAIGMLDVALVIVVGIALFDVPFRGSVLVLLPLTLLFLTGALGLGMFISAAVKSQVLATQAAMLVTYMPALLLSGFLFAIANMPLPLRLATYLVPARYFLVVTRGVFLKGVGIDVLWPDGIAMLLFAAIGIGLAIRAFDKEIA